jgi:hypothetical protein
MPARMPRQTAASTRRSRGMTYLWFVTIVVLLLPWIFATLIVFFFGMMPTLVALIIDRTQQKFAAVSVAGLNFAGVFPYLLKLWQGPQTFDAAGQIITDVFALFVMYGAAGFGWMVFTAVPPVVHAVLTILDQQRVTLLRSNQRRIIEEWGEGVARTQESGEKSKAA